MARVYRLATDVSEQEKSVGGMFTFGQAGWMVLGLIVFGAVFVALSRVIPAVPALIIGLAPGLGIALPFAFYEKGGLRLSSYLVWQIKFARKSKHMVNTMTYKLDRPKDYAREIAIQEVEFNL